MLLRISSFYRVSLPGVNISRNAEYVFEGDSITIDCEFANPASLSSSPTVTWTVDGDEYTGSSIDNSATPSNPVSTQHLTVGSSKYNVTILYTFINKLCTDYYSKIT